MMTVEALRQHIETGMPDEALQRILDSETAAIERVTGISSAGSMQVRGGTLSFMLTVYGATVTGIVEIDRYGAVETLNGTDYRVLNGGMTFERSQLGDHPASCWADYLTITYALATSPEAVVTLIALCKLAIRYSGLRTETVGQDYTETTLDYTKERNALLRSIWPGSGMVLA